MDASLYIAASGMAARMRSMDLLANDLANAQTVGYRAERPFFEELKAASSAGVRLAGSYSRTSQGQLRQTGGELDLAIEGDGYLTIQTPGGERYTRAGQLRLDSEGLLCTMTGAPVLGQDGPLRLPAGAVKITQEGEIQGPDGQIGALKLSKFAPGTRLIHEGDSLMRAPPEARPEAATEARTRQGFLEESNVAGVEAMIEMIQAARSFESVAKAVRALDGIDHKAAGELGRTGQ